jgi:hypothetical protein
MHRLVTEGVEGAGEMIRARTWGGVVSWPDCSAKTSRVHGYHGRRAADLPVDAATGGRADVLPGRTADVVEV